MSRFLFLSSKFQEMLDFFFFSSALTRTLKPQGLPLVWGQIRGPITNIAASVSFHHKPDQLT